jgi:hypothetical protein
MARVRWFDGFLSRPGTHLAGEDVRAGYSAIPRGWGWGVSGPAGNGTRCLVAITSRSPPMSAASGRVRRPVSRLGWTDEDERLKLGCGPAVLLPRAVRRPPCLHRLAGCFAPGRLRGLLPPDLGRMLRPFSTFLARGSPTECQSTCSTVCGKIGTLCHRLSVAGYGCID